MGGRVEPGALPRSPQLPSLPCALPGVFGRTPIMAVGAVEDRIASVLSPLLTTSVAAFGRGRTGEGEGIGEVIGRDATGEGDGNEDKGRGGVCSREEEEDGAC